MRFRKLEVMLGLLISVAVANAEGGSKAEAEGGEGAKGAIAPLPKDEKEFYEKTSRLNSLSTRILEAEKQFHELVRAKAGEKNPEEKQRIIKQMVEVTKDRNRSADEYAKIKTELELRYPNKGAHLNRRYQTQSKKSLEEMEGAAGLDELLTKTKKLVEKKFATFSADEDGKSTSVPVPDPMPEKPKRLRLEK